MLRYEGTLRSARTFPLASTLRRVTARDSRLWRLDWVLIGAVVVLSVLGALLVWSATRPGLIESGEDPMRYLKRHSMHVGVGLLLGGLVAMLDHRLLRAYAPIIYAVACIALVVVLTPAGATINGAKSWIELGSAFQLQPSELAKVGVVLLLATMLAEPRDGEEGPGTVDVLLTLGLAAVPAILVVLQPDAGTTLVFGAMTLGMLLVSGAPRRWVFGLLLAGGLAVGLAWRLGVLEPYQIKRFTAFANPEADPRGAGYTAEQARITVGSGELFGKGLFNGDQTTGHFVPEQHTDFIFTVAGEELGFVGAVSIVVLLGVVLWRGLRIATQCEDTFGRLVATGVVCWLTFQGFQNIGMAVGIMPVTGLPLPLLSYGGTATLATMMAIGLLLAVHLRGRRFE